MGGTCLAVRISAEPMETHAYLADAEEDLVAEGHVLPIGKDERRGLAHSSRIEPELTWGVDIFPVFFFLYDIINQTWILLVYIKLLKELKNYECQCSLWLNEKREKKLDD